MEKKTKRQRWTTHTPEALESLGKVFEALGKKAKDVAEAMEKRNIDNFRVEHWQGTKDGVGAAERFLLDCQDKVSGSVVGEMLKKIEAINSRAATKIPRSKSRATQREN